MSFAEIKEQALQLPPEQRHELASVLRQDDDDDWDRQMKADLAAGRLDHLLAEVDADIAAGRVRDLP